MSKADRMYRQEQFKKFIYRVKLLVNILYALILSYNVIKTILTYVDTHSIARLIIMILSIIAFIFSIILIIIGLRTDLSKVKAKVYKKNIKGVKKVLKVFVTLVTLYIAIESLFTATSSFELAVAWTSIGNNCLSLLTTLALFLLNKAIKKIGINVKEGFTEAKQSVSGKISIVKEKLPLKKKKDAVVVLENETEKNEEKQTTIVGDKKEETTLEEKTELIGETIEEKQKKESTKEKFFSKINSIKNKLPKFKKDKKKEELVEETTEQEINKEEVIEEIKTQEKESTMQKISSKVKAIKDKLPKFKQVEIKEENENKKEND